MNQYSADYERLTANMRETIEVQAAQIAMMREALESLSALGIMAVHNGSPHWIFPIKVMHRSNEALAATEPNKQEYRGVHVAKEQGK